METTLTGLAAIPIEYVVGIAQSKATPAQRRPYIELLERWGEEQGCMDEVRQVLKRLREGKEIDVGKMPREVMPRYRQPELAKRLVQIVRDINDTIAAKTELWTWAHVMRVMTDEGIIARMSPNKFDEIICSMIPDKGRDTVRKHGDYGIMHEKDTWQMWPRESYLEPEKAHRRVVCNQIALMFAPILQRTIRVDF